MAYKNTVYQKAINVLERRRERATLEANSRMIEISQKLPEIDEIQKKLSAIGFSISKLFFHKGNREDEVNKLRKASLALQKEKRKFLLKTVMMRMHSQQSFSALCAVIQGIIMTVCVTAIRSF